jgi:methylthioribose-1-phosphate isomerase
MNIADKLNFQTLDWQGDYLRLIDQTKLPREFTYYDCHRLNDFIDAIKRLVVRGAPAIGIAAGYAIAIAAKKGWDMEKTARALIDARPTAVNLSWAVERMMNVAESCASDPRSLEQEAIAIHHEDAEMCQKIGEHGANLIEPGYRIITHCNAGALATGGIGTALAVIYTAHFASKDISVWVDETRPLLQGARLTTWELGKAGVPHTLICDNMSGSLLAAGKIDCAIVGADRIAANYDVANKIGTYNLAVLCRHHQVPFYIAAPSSTFDAACPDGKAIPIEDRDPGEVAAVFGQAIAPDGVTAYNPAFDVTPHNLISGIITEKGIIRP